MSSGDYTGALILCLHLQHLDGFGKNQFAIEALGSEEADLTVTGVQLIQALEGDALTVTDSVFPP